MGKLSRDKGARGEREFVKLIPGAQKVPLSGAVKEFPHDVLIPWREDTLKVEIKRRKGGFTTLYDWFSHNNPDLLAFRADHQEWLVCMKVDTLLKLIDKK